MPPSHHRPGGGFRNPWPGVIEHGFGDVLRWQLGRIVAHLPEDPEAAAFPLATPAFARPRAPADVLTVTWVGHSTVLVQIGLAAFVRERGAREVSELDWGGETAVGEARVVCTPAQHFSARGLGDRMRTLWCSWVVRVSGRALYFGGDSAYHNDFRTIGERYGPFDVSLLPIGAYEPRWFLRVVHMDPDEAVGAFLDLNTCRSPARRAVMVGIHWGTFKLTDEAMDEPPRRAERAWRAAGLAEGELWVMRHGETRVL